MENFRYVKFGFASLDNYLIYNKLPLLCPAEKSQPNTIEFAGETETAPTSDQEKPPLGAEVFDSSNFETFKEPIIPLSPSSHPLLEVPTPLNNALLKKSRLETQSLPDRFGSQGPTQRPNDNFNDYLQALTDPHRADSVDERMIEPISIMTDTNATSISKQQALPLQPTTNSLKGKQRGTFDSAATLFPGAEGHREFSNQKRVTFSPVTEDRGRSGTESEQRQISPATHRLSVGSNNDSGVNSPRQIYRDDASKLSIKVQVLENEKRINDALITEMRQKLSRAESALEQYAAQLSGKDKDDELIETKKILAKLQGQTIKQNSQIAELQRKLDSKDTQKGQVKEQPDSGLRDALTRLQSQQDQNRSVVLGLQRRLGELETENRGLKDQLANVKAKGLNLPSTTDRSQLDDPQRIQAALGKAQTQIIQLQTEKRSLESQLAKVQQELARQNENRGPAIDQSARLRTVDDPSSSALVQLKNTNFLLERENESLKRAKTELAKDLRSLEENCTRLQNQRSQDVFALQQAKDKIEELEAQAQSNLKKAENFKNLLNNTLNLNDKLTKQKLDIEEARDKLMERLKQFEGGSTNKPGTQPNFSVNSRLPSRPMF